MTLQCCIVHVIITECSICKSGTVFNNQRGNYCNAGQKLQLESKLQMTFAFTYGQFVKLYQCHANMKGFVVLDHRCIQEFAHRA